MAKPADYTKDEIEILSACIERQFEGSMPSRIRGEDWAKIHQVYNRRASEAGFRRRKLSGIAARWYRHKQLQPREAVTAPAGRYLGLQQGITNLITRALLLEAENKKLRRLESENRGLRKSIKAFERTLSRGERQAKQAAALLAKVGKRAQGALVIHSFD